MQLTTKLSFFHHVHGNAWSCWSIYYLITNCYLQNWFDVKIVWNCCNSLYQFQCSIGNIDTVYILPTRFQSNINIQNVLEETCTFGHKWLPHVPVYILIRKPNDNEPYFYSKLHVYCIKVIIQCLELGFSSIKASNIPWSPYKIVIWGKKIEMYHWSFLIGITLYCKVINQCLTERIPQHKASHLTGIYLDHLLCTCKCSNQTFY